MSVRVSVILKQGDRGVVTVPPDVTVFEAVHMMAEHDVGALPVSSDGQTLSGIVSERDVMREIARLGPSCLEQPVSELMTAGVTTCSPDTTVDELMATMIGQRIRHLPVLVDGALVGVVSIRDVVQSRLDELELQTKVLEQYVTGSAS